MADVAELALAGAGPMINNFEKAWYPVKGKAQKMRPRRRGGRRRNDDHDDEPTPEDRGWVLKKRSEVQSDEEIVERVPRNQQMVPYRPGVNRRASSLDRNEYRGGRDDRRVGAYRGRNDDSDSEGSVPPRSRVSRQQSKRSSSKPSSDSEDLGSSTDDERRCRHISRKKWLTGGLAAVATIHAAAKVYSSLEARDKRHEQVLAGELSPEEARKQRNRGRWQDAAAVGVAAVGIRGAVGEWHEVEDAKDEHKKMLKEREERHQKRLERQRRARFEGRGDRMDSSGRQPRIEGRPQQKALKDYAENDRHRSQSMGAYDDDDHHRGYRESIRSKSRRRSDE